MFELGEESSAEHQAIIDLATSFNFDKKLFVGENFSLGKTNELQFKTYQDLEEYLNKNPLENQSILIKGSRGMALERILDVIN
jgi:UDP-N-acetylmuramoyl-tripeptide--D-alanyl-D-alanine ligase